MKSRTGGGNFIFNDLVMVSISLLFHLIPFLNHYQDIINQG